VDTFGYDIFKTAYFLDERKTHAPRLNFARLPTPIEHLPRLSKLLGGAQIYVKRDDQTGLSFGGNKTRKLEFLVAEAQAQGAKTLISAFYFLFDLSIRYLFSERKTFL